MANKNSCAAPAVCDSHISSAGLCKVIMTGFILVLIVFWWCEIVPAAVNTVTTHHQDHQEHPDYPGLSVEEVFWDLPFDYLNGPSSDLGPDFNIIDSVFGSSNDTGILQQAHSNEIQDEHNSVHKSTIFSCQDENFDSCEQEESMDYSDSEDSFLGAMSMDEALGNLFADFHARHPADEELSAISEDYFDKIDGGADTYPPMKDISSGGSSDEESEHIMPVENVESQDDMSVEKHHEQDDINVEEFKVDIGYGMTSGNVHKNAFRVLIKIHNKVVDSLQLDRSLSATNRDISTSDLISLTGSVFSRIAEKAKSLPHLTAPSDRFCLPVTKEYILAVGQRLQGYRFINSRPGLWTNSFLPQLSGNAKGNSKDSKVIREQSTAIILITKILLSCAQAVNADLPNVTLSVSDDVNYGLTREAEILESGINGPRKEESKGDVSLPTKAARITSLADDNTETILADKNSVQERLPVKLFTITNNRKFGRHMVSIITVLWKILNPNGDQFDLSLNAKYEDIVISVTYIMSEFVKRASNQGELFYGPMNDTLPISMDYLKKLGARLTTFANSDFSNLDPKCIWQYLLFCVIKGDNDGATYSKLSNQGCVVLIAKLVVACAQAVSKECHCVSVNVTDEDLYSLNSLQERFYVGIDESNSFLGLAMIPQVKTKPSFPKDHESTPKHANNGFVFDRPNRQNLNSVRSATRGVATEHQTHNPNVPFQMAPMPPGIQSPVIQGGFMAGAPAFHSIAVQNHLMNAHLASIHNIPQPRAPFTPNFPPVFSGQPAFYPPQMVFAQPSPYMMQQQRQQFMPQMQ